jgi:parallel beta-helix repeat protein
MPAMRIPALSLLVLAQLLTACASSPSRTPEPLREYAGVLRGVTVFAGEVVLADDVLVPAGSTLIIRPGTVVRVRAAEGTKIDPEYLSPATELLVRGTLRAEGTPSAPIRFVPLVPPAGDEPAWAGIELDGAVESRVVSVEIEGADTGILCIGSSPLLESNRLRGCRYGLVLQKGSAARVLGNRIEDGEGGIFCWLGSAPYLKGNVVSGHDEEGIFVDGSSRPWLDRNSVTANAIGLALYPRDLPYDPAGIHGNGEDVRLLGGNGISR